MQITRMKLPESKYSLKCPYSMQPEYITVHNTDNDASAMAEISYMQGNGSSTSFHAAVDDCRVVEGLPFDRNGWHSGDGNGTGNRKTIGVEICYSKSGGERFTKAERLAAEYVAYLLTERGWGVDRVKKHQDWSGKYCPHRTLDLGWQRFLNMVQSYLDDASNVANTPGTAGTYTVKSGDTLSGIAAAYGMSLSEIIKLNPQISNPNVIHSGDTVKFATAASSAPSPAPAPAPAPVFREVDAYYWVATQKHGRLPKVKNQEDFAGYEDSPITKIAIQATEGCVKYRVHIKGGKWLPYVTGYDANDHVNGYAGNGQPIDALEVYYTTPDGMAVKKAKYRVAPCGGDYYGWQYDDETGNGQDGYAGVFGKTIGKVQIVIE